MSKLMRLAAASLMMAGLLGAAGIARADDDQEVINRGDCNQISDWKLRIRTDGPNRLDLNFEAGEVAGQRWRVRMNYNGTLVVNRIVRAGANGEFDVDREVANQAGPDTLQGNARNLQTGELCQGSVTANF